MEIFDLLTYDYNKIEDVNDIPNTWTPINSLTTPPREAGLYELKVSSIWRYDRTTSSAQFRFRINGGDWSVFEHEPKDRTDINPFCYVFPYVKSDSDPLTFEFEAEKESTQNQFDIVVSNIVCERKNLLSTP